MLTDRLRISLVEVRRRRRHYLAPFRTLNEIWFVGAGGRDLREGEINQGAKSGRRALIRASA